eukprot:592510_1
MSFVPHTCILPSVISYKNSTNDTNNQMNYIQSLHSEPAFRAKMRSKADARCQSTRQQEINMHECYQFEWQQSIDTRTMDMPLHKNTDDSMTESTYFKMIDQDYVANQRSEKILKIKCWKVLI